MQTTDQKENNTFEHWPLVLVEMLHLLGLFFSHSRHSKGSKATGLLYEQFIRYFEVLSRIPNHDGVIAIRKAASTLTADVSGKAGYDIVCGGVAILDDQALKSIQRAKHLSGALRQAFGCLSEQGIHSLLIRWPGRSLEKIEQLRLALNIVARFAYAAENASSITFRYFGRTLVLPLIKDFTKRPDPNLTLTAALNSLSETNARELIKQARAYHELLNDKNEDFDSSNLYKLIFNVRSLRSQLVQPLVEMNTLASEDIERMRAALTIKGESIRRTEEQAGVSSDLHIIPKEAPPRLPGEMFGYHLDISLEHFLKSVEKVDKDIWSRIGGFLSDEDDINDQQTLADRLAQFSQLLKALEGKPESMALMDKALHFIHDRLETVGRDVLQGLVIQRQGIKIAGPIETTVIGMVHPKLVDLLMLTKEKIIAEKKIAMIGSILSHDEKNEYDSLGVMLGVDKANLDTLFACFRACFQDGKFSQQRYQRSIRAAREHADAFFTLLWCYSRERSEPLERIQTLHALQSLIGDIDDVKQAVGFLMTNIYQTIFDIQFSDRNAYYLLNRIIGNSISGINWDIKQTPSAILKVEKGANRVAQKYAAWRLDFDHIRSLTKMRTLYDKAKEVLNSESDQPKERNHITFLLSLIRESYIFFALAGGETARTTLLDAIGLFGNPLSGIYQTKHSRAYLPSILVLMQLSIQGIGKIGVLKDIDTLKEFEKNAGALKSLNSDPMHMQRLNKVVKWVAPAIKSIHLRSQ